MSGVVCGEGLEAHASDSPFFGMSFECGVTYVPLHNNANAIAAAE